MDSENKKSPEGGLFVTSRFRWNEWRTTKAGTIAGCITVCADVNQDYKYVTSGLD
jgi:urocanate hydratase